MHRRPRLSADEVDLGQYQNGRSDAQDESEVVFRRRWEDLVRQGVIFSEMVTALREYPEIA